MSPIRKILLLFIAAVLLISPVCLAAAPSERIPYTVACVGDSLTLGIGSTEPRTESWPAVLQRSEGSLALTTYNFGVYGSTVETGMPWSYTYTPSYRASLQCDADVYLILLGSNDSNSPTRDENFEAAYRELLAQYLALPQQPQIIVLLPPDMYFEAGSLWRMSNENIVPLRETERRIAEELRLPVIDLTELGSMEEYSVDGGHFSAEGYAIFAQFIYDGLCDILES